MNRWGKALFVHSDDHDTFLHYSAQAYGFAAQTGGEFVPMTC